MCISVYQQGPFFNFLYTCKIILQNFFKHKLIALTVLNKMAGDAKVQTTFVVKKLISANEKKICQSVFLFIFFFRQPGIFWCVEKIIINGVVGV